MFNWLRRKLGLSADFLASTNNTHMILEELDLLHKRMDRIETALGPWRADGVGRQTGISHGRDPSDPKVINESANIGAAVLAKLAQDKPR